MVLQDLPPSSRPGFRPKLFRFRSTSSYGFSFSAGMTNLTQPQQNVSGQRLWFQGQRMFGSGGVNGKRGQTEAGLTGDKAREVGQGSLVNELFLSVTTGSRWDLLKLLDMTLAVSHCPGMLCCLPDSHNDWESRPPQSRRWQLEISQRTFQQLKFSKAKQCQKTHSSYTLLRQLSLTGIKQT